MSFSVASTFLLIVVARIADVTLDTLRTASIVQGRRLFSAMLGFAQAIIYVSAIAKVLLNMDHHVYILAYGTGYALGTYLGITVEQYLAFGQQVAAIITRKGLELAKALTAAGYRVAEVHGQVRDGEVTILYVQVARKRARELIRDASAIDGDCFCVVNDVRVSAFGRAHIVHPAPE